MKTSLLRAAAVCLGASSCLLLTVHGQDAVPSSPPPPGAEYDRAPAPPPPPPAEVENAPATEPVPAPAPVEPASPISSLGLPPGLSRSQVQSAILAALQHRDWRVVSTGEHTVTAHLLHHHVDATLTISYNRERVDFYAESYLVGHHAENRITSFTREDWIRNLEHDIRTYAGR